MASQSGIPCRSECGWPDMQSRHVTRHTPCVVLARRRGPLVLRSTANDIGHVDESELLARPRTGDDDAFAAIFREHYPVLVVSATRLLAERALAEDIVQDVMLALWRRRDLLGLAGPRRASLQQAPRNRALHRLRQARTATRREGFVRGPTESPPADAHVVSV